MKRILGLLVCLVTLCALPVYSGDDIVGIVDMNAIILLHPDMAKFKPDYKLFVSDIASKDDPAYSRKMSTVRAEIANLKKEIKEAQKAIEAEEFDFNNARVKADNEYKNSIKGNVGTDTLLLQQTIYNQELIRLDREHSSDYKKYTNQIFNKQTEIAKLEQYLNIANLTSPKETKEKFKAIVDEVRKTVIKLQKKYGLSIVLNIPANRKKYKVEDEYIDFSLNDIFKAKEIFSEPNGIRAEDMKNDIEAKTAIWLEKESSIFDEYNEIMPKGGIVSGGRDLTKDVLIELYRRYKVNDEVSKAIINSL